MIHQKITNVLLFLLIASLWFLAYFYFQLQIDMQNQKSSQELKALKKELVEWKTKQQDDFKPPELPPEPIKVKEFEKKTVDIPGIFEPVRRYK